MNNIKPHITVGQTESDFFLSGERSKTIEHKDRLRSVFNENEVFENAQKLMKNEDNER